MRELADALRREIDASHPRLGRLTDEEAARTRGTGKWTRKEILGHLIDSAANNHQRFVRAQLADPLVFPGYEQDGWVAANDYRGRTWAELLELWTVLNRHLAHVVGTVPPPARQTRCVIGKGEPVTLEWLVRDYLRHLRHHLAQLLSS